MPGSKGATRVRGAPDTSGDAHSAVGLPWAGVNLTANFTEKAWSSMVQLSVGIPFHNNVGTLEAAIESVLLQTHPADEVLLVDDGSTDGSLAIAKSFEGGAVRVVSDGVNRGLVARLNELAGAARGRFLARMDADDVCHPERFARQMDYMEQHPQVDVLATGAWIIDERHAVVGRRHCSLLPTGRTAPLGRGLLLHPTVMAKRSWHLAHPYDPAFVRAEDKELWCRTWQQSVFARLAEPLLFYREARRIPVASYRRSCRTDRRILRTYGPVLAGRPRTVALIAEAVAIEAVTVATAGHALGAAVVALRSGRVTQAERTAAEAILAASARPAD